MFNIIKNLKLLLPKNLLHTISIFNGPVGKRLFFAEHLKSRSLLQAKGENVSEFLQGMITNDINHLTEIKSSMFTMFLNVQGRVLFDAIVYRSHEDSFLIECDTSIVQTLINHLKLHKVRRKIFFEESDLKIWALFEDNIDTKSLKETDLKTLYISPAHSPSNTLLEIFSNDVIIFKDPRLHYLGNRLYLPPYNSLEGISEILPCKNKYKILRYKLGVGEGVEELPRAKCLPLEANCDYLHGISYQKGCYIGQELTARTHHTGVVRKRYLPLILDKVHTGTLESKMPILNEKGKSVGKVISTAEDFGIGVMRLQESLNAQSLKVGNIGVSTFKPGWWPIEMSK